jgi:hypothetical protein
VRRDQVARYVWNDQDSLADHFRRYGRQVGARTLAEFDALARQTIERGIRFTFRTTARHRIGYYDRRRHRLVILQDDDETIISLSRRNENYVRNLVDSTYGR